MSTETQDIQAITPDQPVKVTFDEKQQEKVNQLIREKQGEAAREVRTQLAEAQRQLDAAKAELVEAKRLAAGTKEPDPQVEALHHQVKVLASEKDAALKASKDQINAFRKKEAIREAQSKLNFVDSAAVLKLTSDSIIFDDASGRVKIVNEQGIERLNGDLNPMTLNEFYAEYANANPHMVKADSRGGAGSSESQRQGPAIGGYELTDLFGPKSNSRIANELAQKNYGEYKRLRVLAVQAGLIGK